MLWRTKISITLMLANAQMLLSRGRCQGTLNPAHAHHARCSHLASHRSPAQRPQDYNFAHSRVSAWTNAPSASLPTLVVGSEHPEGIKLLFL
jgi:hypothetical protein